MIDTLSCYYGTIKYKKTYIFPESEKGSLTDYEDSDSDSECDSECDILNDILNDSESESD